MCDLDLRATVPCYNNYDCSLLHVRWCRVTTATAVPCYKCYNNYDCPLLQVEVGVGYGSKFVEGDFGG
jgi:hypothetical protein